MRSGPRDDGKQVSAPPLAGGAAHAPLLRLAWSPLWPPAAAAAPPYELPGNVALVTLTKWHFPGLPGGATYLLRLAHTCGEREAPDRCGTAAAAASVSLCPLFGRRGGSLTVTETTAPGVEALAARRARRVRVPVAAEPLCFKADAAECPPAPGAGPEAAAAADAWVAHAVECGGSARDEVTLRSMQVRTFAVAVA